MRIYLTQGLLIYTEFYRYPYPWYFYRYLHALTINTTLRLIKVYYFVLFRTIGLDFLESTYDDLSIHPKGRVLSSDIDERTIEHLLNFNIKHRIPEEKFHTLVSFEGWLTFQGLKPSTRYRYLEVVSEFLEWIYSRRLRYEDLSIMLLEEFLGKIRRRGVKQSTLSWYIIGVRKFLRYLYHVTDDERFKNLYEKIRVPIRRTTLPEILTRQEVEALLAAITNKKHCALIALIYETGCRVSEALNLRIGDTEVSRHGLRVTFRKSKSEPRRVLLILYADLVSSWLKVHRARRDPKAYLFYGRDPYKKLSRSMVFYIIKRAVAKSGINKKVYPHLLRHTRATELYKVFKELEMMKWFGWRTRSMIDVYSRISQEDLENKYLEKAVGLSSNEGEYKLIKCNNCGRLNLPGSRFCCNCGVKLI